MDVHCESRGEVALIRLDDGAVNALGPSACAAIEEALAGATGASAVVLTGRPRVFSAGLDLKWLLDAGAAEAASLIAAFEDLLWRLITAPTPIVAACAGHAMGGGALLLAACDLRLGGPAGRIGITGTRLGIPYPTTAVELIRAAVGEGEAARVLLLGEEARDDDRLRLGWLHEIADADAVVERAIERAAGLARLDAGAYATTKARLRGPALERIERHRDEDRERYVAAATSAATQARIRAALRR